MNTTLATTRSHGLLRRCAPHLGYYLKLTFVSGPKRLLTSRISTKCAAAMVAMCSPSLLFCALLTIPTMIFQSPEQNAYFHFARVVENDPTRWAVLLVSGLCAIMSLAVPATMPEPRESDFLF